MWSLRSLRIRSKPSRRSDMDSTDNRKWSLTVTFQPVVDQGWEEQNPGEDFASRVLTAIKKIWEFDDEVSNDFKGYGFNGDTFWEMTEDRTQMVMHCDDLDPLGVAIDSIMMSTIPLRMELINNWKE